jgi:hypothetical protein
MIEYCENNTAGCGIEGDHTRCDDENVRYREDNRVYEVEGVDGDEEANTVIYWFRRGEELR